MNLGMSDDLAPPSQQTTVTGPGADTAGTGASTASSQDTDLTAPSPVLAKRPPALSTPPVQVSSWTSSFRVVRVAMDDALVVHSGPSEFHAAVGVIPSDGDGVQIIGDCRDLWCPIRHNGITGWVNRYYLTEKSSPADTDNDTR